MPNSSHIRPVKGHLHWKDIITQRSFNLCRPKCLQFLLKIDWNPYEKLIFSQSLSAHYIRVMKFPFHFGVYDKHCRLWCFPNQKRKKENVAIIRATLTKSRVVVYERATHVNVIVQQLQLHQWTFFWLFLSFLLSAIKQNLWNEKTKKAQQRQTALKEVKSFSSACCVQ